jgi:hypothetical protein
MAIGILDVDLTRPWIIGRRQPDTRTRGGILFEESYRVTNADPDPGSGVALVSFAEHEARGLAGDR